jgi:hypothetical protein
MSIERSMGSACKRRDIEPGEADLRYQYRLMRRWCRRFGKTDLDWVTLAAARYRDRNPLPPPIRLAA